jgi:4-diphosphocytidyl-2-C-methyl-D-erythritol kinase
MLTFPNAKINIGLFITAKRKDGYHDLETIFYPVQVKDALEIVDSPGANTSIHLSGLPVAGDQQNNLVWKAYTLLQRDFPQRVGPLSIHLHKVIPMGAGLGGGSADGAFMLKMLNDRFNLGMDLNELEQYALELGSDCPFFIRNKAAFASGRGEQLEETALDLSDYSIQLIYPDIHISTALAFSGITPAPASYSLRNISSLPLDKWKDHIRNDFEVSLFPEYPVLQKMKEQLYVGGALYASLSGTGSTVYGIFKKGERAEINSEISFKQHYHI